MTKAAVQMASIPRRLCRARVVAEAAEVALAERVVAVAVEDGDNRQGVWGV